MKKTMTTRTYAALFAGAAATAIAAAAPAAYAQSGPAATDDEIVVTGSRIKRKSQLDLPSPLATVGSEDIAAIGATDISDITQTLTINTGAENRPDAFSQNGTVGTSSINLRGLGLSSTLVLLNGKRQVLTAQTNNAGVQFVDTSSLVPLIAVDRVEILKDGASAIYGSDAVAGVVNFITKDDFEGVQLSADYQFASYDSDVNEVNLQALFGAQGERGSIIAAVSYLNREPLYTADRRLSQPADDSSNVGNPGSFIPLAGTPLGGAVPPGTPFIDPTACGSVGGIELPLGPAVPGVGQIGLCRFDFGEYFNLIANESRVQGYFDAEYLLTDTLTATLEFGYAENKADRGNSPRFPSLTSPVVPASHPDNVFGEDILWLGRINGSGANPETGRQDTRSDSRTWRVAGTVGSDEFLNNGYWEISLVHAENNFLVRTPDTVTERLNLALNGFGGPNCDSLAFSTATTADDPTPGAGGCQYFNPFGSSLTGTGTANSAELLDWLLEDQVRNLSSNLSVIEGVMATDLFEMAGGMASVALGFQYREQQLDVFFDSISRDDGFSFLFGDQDYGGSQDVYALFSEVALPLGQLPVLGEVELSAAVRYEDYGGSIGDTVDPKIAILARPTDDLSFRASYAQSFRAPSVHQLVSSGTALEQVIDPAAGAGVFAAVRTLGNPDLAPEESDAINVGFSWRPEGLVNIDVDYWRFDFTDAIVIENPQAIINADFADDGVFNSGRVILNDAGFVSLVQSAYANATSIETSGIDFTVTRDFAIGEGILTPTFEGTYILTYDLDDPQAGAIDGLGRRNDPNIGTSTPPLRFNAGLNFDQGPITANFFARYISSYDDDEDIDTVGLQEIDSIVTYDAQVSIDMSSVFGSIEALEAVQATVGVINLTDEEPPYVNTNGGYDPRVHDPRGRLVYFRLAAAL